jgi:hypothetical protein
VQKTRLRADDPREPSTFEVIVTVDACATSTAGPAPDPSGAPRPSATFTHLTTLHPRRLSGLPQWWRDGESSAKGRVRVARGLVLTAPECEGSGTWRMRGWLRSAWLRRPIPVELELWPRLGKWTKMRLQPGHRVHVGRRYYRNGHRALEAVITRLDSELPRG